MVQGHNIAASGVSKDGNITGIGPNGNWRSLQVTKFGSLPCQGNLDCGEIEEPEDRPAACTRTNN